MVGNIGYKGDAFLNFGEEALVLNCFFTVLICFNKLHFAFIVLLCLLITHDRELISKSWTRQIVADTAHSTMLGYLGESVRVTGKYPGC
jgi:hypothetical protein